MLLFLIVWGCVVIVIYEIHDYTVRTQDERPITTSSYIVLLFLWPVAVIMAIIRRKRK